MLRYVALHQEDECQRSAIDLDTYLDGRDSRRSCICDTSRSTCLRGTVVTRADDSLVMFLRNVALALILTDRA